MMLYMAIERFKPGCLEKAYGRFRERGRMLPDGLTYIDSWLESDGDRCFQIMECDDADLLQQWAENWNDLIDFEFVAVVTSKQAQDIVGQ